MSTHPHAYQTLAHEVKPPRNQAETYAAGCGSARVGVPAYSDSRATRPGQAQAAVARWQKLRGRTRSKFWSGS